MFSITVEGSIGQTSVISSLKILEMEDYIYKAKDW